MEEDYEILGNGDHYHYNRVCGRRNLGEFPELAGRRCGLCHSGGGRVHFMGA